MGNGIAFRSKSNEEEKGTAEDDENEDCPSEETSSIAKEQNESAEKDGSDTRKAEDGKKKTSKRSLRRKQNSVDVASLPNASGSAVGHRHLMRQRSVVPTGSAEISVRRLSVDHFCVQPRQQTPTVQPSDDNDQEKETHISEPTNERRRASVKAFLEERPKSTSIDSKDEKPTHPTAAEVRHISQGQLFVKKLPPLKKTQTTTVKNGNRAEAVVVDSSPSSSPRPERADDVFERTEDALDDLRINEIETE